MVAKCHLEFDGFDSFLINALRKIFEENAFPDVTLVGDDEFSIQAHRIILSAHSSVLERALIESKSTKPTLYLKGFNFQDLSSLLQFLYLGEVSLPFAQASELLKIAKFLKIHQLGKECDVTDKNLNKMFSVIAKDDFVNSESTAGDSIPVDDFEEYCKSSKDKEENSEGYKSTENEEENSEENERMEDDKDYFEEYKSTEDEEETSEELEFDSSVVKEENDTDDTSSRQYDEKQEFKKRQFHRTGNFPGRGDDIEGPDYGADMVGKPLPGFSLSRSVTYSHYYFVRSKPINGESWARCNICWYKLGSGAHRSGQKKPFLRISDVRKNSNTTSPLISHINCKHPDFMDQFMEQQAEATKAFNTVLCPQSHA